MATTEISVISITDDGRQLTAHGYDCMDTVRAHIAQRLGHNGTTTRYTQFVIVITANDGIPTTTCHQLPSQAARRFVRGQ